MFERPRDKNGEMSRKNGNTLIRTLKRIPIILKHSLHA